MIIFSIISRILRSTFFNSDLNWGLLDTLSDNGRLFHISAIPRRTLVDQWLRKVVRI